MKLDFTLRRAIAQAAERFGGAGKFGKKTGIDPGTVSRYINGKINSVSDASWSKLEKILKGKEIVQDYRPCPVLKWHEVEKDPRMILRNERMEIALQVRGNDMAPTLYDRDVIVADRVFSLEEIPDNRIVLALQSENSDHHLFCRRLRKIDGKYWFFSDVPKGFFFQADMKNILWAGIVLRKICEL